MMHLSVFFSITLHLFFFFFFNDTATTEIYTLSLHDALPILLSRGFAKVALDVAIEPMPELQRMGVPFLMDFVPEGDNKERSEEHTSELQSRQYLVCRLLLEKKKKKQQRDRYSTTYTCDTHLV